MKTSIYILTPVCKQHSLYNFINLSIAFSLISNEGKCGKKSLPEKNHI